MCYISGTDFFGRSLFSTGCYVLGTNFLGPIGQESKAKTVIISGLAVTAGQFLVIIIQLYINAIALPYLDSVA